MDEKIGYARVSTREQNLDPQIQQLTRAGCIKIFCDEGSGKTARDRTQLGELFNYLREGDLVIVTKLDRLSRSLADLLSIAETIREKGAHLRSLGEDFDTSSGTGKMLFHFMGVLAEFERDRIRERTMEGLQAARARGRIGGRPPIFKERQHRLVARMYRDGESIREIARTLNVSQGTVRRSLVRSELITERTSSTSK